MDFEKVRPERLKPMVTGKRVKTVGYGIKAASDYTRDAEAYMDSLEAAYRSQQELLRAREWVSVEQELPPVESRCLVLTREPSMIIATKLPGVWFTGQHTWDLKDV